MVSNFYNFLQNKLIFKFAPKIDFCGRKIDLSILLPEKQFVVSTVAFLSFGLKKVNFEDFDKNRFMCSWADFQSFWSKGKFRFCPIFNLQDHLFFFILGRKSILLNLYLFCHIGKINNPIFFNYFFSKKCVNFISYRTTKNSTRSLPTSFRILVKFFWFCTLDRHFDAKSGRMVSQSPQRNTTKSLPVSFQTLVRHQLSKKIDFMAFGPIFSHFWSEGKVSIQYKYSICGFQDHFLFQFELKY